MTRDDVAEQVSKAQAEYTSLQEMIWPEPGVCTEQDLYVRLEGGVGFLDAGDLPPQAPVRPIREPSHISGLRFFSGGTAAFDSWFNLFNLGTWQRHSDLKDLHLMLRGAGVFQLTVTLRREHRSWEQISRVIELRFDQPFRLDISALLADQSDDGAVLTYQLAFLDAGPDAERSSGVDGYLLEAAWQTREAARRQPDLAVAVTTFRREDEVLRTMQRFGAFRAQSARADKLQMIVTDNGQTLAAHMEQLQLSCPDGVHLVPNENLGGAGGFTRGMLEAQARRASHCLFMDDDAATHMQCLDRTWMLLAYATDPNTAVAGAMIDANHRWAMWENGARFHGRCQPQHMGTDLRDREQVAKMEFEVSGPAPEGLYGGWWYFAFPISAAKHLAFPFFVRGDDVSFSLANGFNIVRLNGVVSFQEGFTDKESPQTWYLDLRSHLVHHLSLPQLASGNRTLAKIPLSFFLRNLPRMHYDTLAAVNLAIEDVLQGPEFFDRNIDMAEQRAALKALTETESWQPLMPGQGLAPERTEPPAAWKRHFMKLSLNGLLWPGFGRFFGKRITLAAHNRGHIGMIWGAREITVLNTARNRFYTVKHSKSAAWTQGLRFLRNLRQLLQAHDRLRSSYQAQYEAMTDRPYWEEKLGFPAAADASRAAE